MIHPTTVIEKGAQLGAHVSVGPYSYIGAHVRIADHCTLRNHVTITGHTRIGEGCVFFPGCIIGEIPQDLKYSGEVTETWIDEDNQFREYVTVHAGTRVGGGTTRIGKHNRFLVGVHLAHDTQIGNHVVISNHVQIAGHVHVEDCATMGGQTGVHQFVTIGAYAMIGGQSHVTMDVVPYMITRGYPAEVRGVNVPGLRRWRVADSEIEALTSAFKMLYSKKSKEYGTFRQRLQNLEQDHHGHEHVARLCAFLKRTLAVRTGRHLESQRKDTPGDSSAFFSKQDPASAKPPSAQASLAGGEG